MPVTEKICGALLGALLLGGAVLWGSAVAGPRDALLECGPHRPACSAEVRDQWKVRAALSARLTQLEKR